MNRALPEGSNLRDAEGYGQPDWARQRDAGAAAHDSLDNPHAYSSRMSQAEIKEQRLLEAQDKAERMAENAARRARFS